MRRCVGAALLCLLITVSGCGKKKKADGGSGETDLLAREIAVDAASLTGQWTREACAEVDDIDDPPDFPKDDAEAQFAKQMYEMAAPMLKEGGVKSTANYLYFKQVQGKREIYDVNIMVFKDVDCCKKMWEGKLPAEVRSVMEELEGVGEEGFGRKGEQITYTFARRGNVYVSVKALMGGTSGVEIAKAIDSRLYEGVESGS